MRNLVLLLVVVISVVACQKELSVDSLNGGGGNGGGSGSGSLIGTWKFIGASANTESIVTISDIGIDLKTVTTSSYNTTNNTGTYTFTSNKMTFAGVGYSINGSATSYMFLDAQPTDTIEFPFSYTLPPSNGEATYRKVGTDSLVFESGSIAIPAYGTQPAQASGTKYKFSGDTLFLITNYAQTTSITDAGAVQTTQNKVNGVVKLLKQ